MKNFIFKKHLNLPVTIKSKQRHINIGLIVAIIITLVMTWFLTDLTEWLSQFRPMALAAPSGYSVSIDQPSINSANQNSIFFTFADAEVGTNYFYRFIDTPIEWNVDWVCQGVPYNYGSGNDQLSEPKGMAIDDTYMYIADGKNHRIMKRLKSDLSYVSKIGSQGSGNDQFGHPHAIEVGDTYVYVADTFNHRIVKRLKSDLSYVSKIGSQGSGVNQFDRPFGIAVDDTYIYVADLMNHRIMKRLKSDLSYVSELDEFNFVYGVTLDDTYLYVADSNFGNYRVSKWLKSDLSYVSEVTAFDGGYGFFNGPHDLAVDHTYLYVSDTWDNKILKFKKSDLSFIAEIEQNSLGDDWIGYNYGIDVDDTHMYWVDDSHRAFKGETKHTGPHEVAGSGTITSPDQNVGGIDLSSLDDGTVILLVYLDDGSRGPDVFDTILKDTSGSGSGGNVSGFAWSSNIGWISFNAADCDTNGNGTYEGVAEGAPAGCPSSGSVNDYGVNIDGDGNFSGYAWSSNVGWISFEESDLDLIDYSFNTNCDTANCTSGNNCTACLSSDNNVYGWAKILSLGDNGWIKLRDAGGSGVSFPMDFPINFPMAFDSPAFGVSIDTGDDPDELTGWAWNGNDNGVGIGWISFNCGDEGSCPTSDYKATMGVANTQPTITFPDSDPSDLCTQPLLEYLRWTFHDVEDGDGGPNQAGYHIQVKKEGDAWSTLQGEDLKLISTASQYNFGQAPSTIEFGTDYNWRIKVLDSEGAWSEWYDNAAFPPDLAEDFTTALHDYPIPNFSWFPEEPSVDEEVQFTDASQIYTSGSAEDCTDLLCNWLWTNPTAVTPGTATIINGTASSTVIIFDSSDDSTTIKLEVTDGAGYSCSASTVPALNAGVRLPTWIEVKQ